jgi:DNA repair protein RadA/Sms
MLVAVLEKKLGLRLQDQDLYLNFAGGFRVSEPAADAGILAAVYSSFRGLPAAAGTVVFGEVGLTGEIRGVAGSEKRLREAAKLGFRRCILPTANLESVDSLPRGAEVAGVSHASEVIERLFS